MSEHAAHASAPAAATFELLWQQDASAFALVRGADGTLSAGDLQLGMPAVADLGLAERSRPGEIGEEDRHDAALLVVDRRSAAARAGL